MEISRQPIPIIVGVGEVRDPFIGVESAEEPLSLILQAIHAAARDTKLPPYDSEDLLSKVESIEVVRTWTWPYDDLAGDLAKEIRAKPNLRRTTPRHGGDQPAKMADEAARRIAVGESKIALVAGGEALASLSAHIAAKGSPPAHWTETRDGLESIFADERRRDKISHGGAHKISAPIQVYPLLENALRAHRGQSIPVNHTESTQMYSEFARIASQNEYAWSYDKPRENEEMIGMISRRNRMICFPYPLLMNAFNTVNLAAACILTSTEYALELGIPKSRWIYVRGGAGTRDSDEFWRRPNFYSSPSISRSLDAALLAADLPVSDVDAYDFYSCFPIVPKLACAHLGLPMIPPYPKPISLLGGLTFFGGAGNNYSMHAITQMTRHLRERRGKNGLILANGGVATYQHVICLSSEPPTEVHQYPQSNPLPETLPSLDDSAFEREPNGRASVETYTVDFARGGSPKLGHVVGRLVSNKKRFLANHGDEKTLIELASKTREPIGRLGSVKIGLSGNNVFSFEDEPRL